MALQVDAGAIVVPVKGADRYLYRGAIVPEVVDEKDIKRLKSIGLVKDVKVKTRPRAAAGASEAGDKAEDQSEAGGGEADGSEDAQTDSETAGSADEAPKSRSRTKK